ncbi:ketopantoate reductase family protein [Subtercola sp. PAMC28395]|uniref:ketopantoate reductase family protein n=1 Tax=Subtercola sp. PAMC28395 TaxID=2846775 RepID=UPI001C0C601C|nr:2-dehydropantoate 2-reductase N-terminal domain-containing protein [Subtercola sp. PAMC28395]QWT24827.1 ketopantoate reductase family protein [Subtercola sp. PAMC28395]
MRRYIIVGAGAIGAILAAQFEGAGIRSVLVARGENLAAIREHGLTVRRPASTDVVRLDVACSPGEVNLTTDDVIVIATKSQDAEAALAEWAWQPVEAAVPANSDPTAGLGAVAIAGPGDGAGTEPPVQRMLGADLPVLTFQNGLSTEDAALRRFSKVYGVSIGIAASHLSPGIVVSPSYPVVGSVWLGRYPDQHDEVQDQFVADLVAAGFDSQSVSNVSAWKARKLLVNAANGLDVLAGDDEDRVVARKRLFGEARAVFEAAGLAVVQDAPRFSLAVQEVPGHTSGRLSTWQSFARGASSEVDYLNGEIVLIARKAGVGAPVNERLQRLLGSQAARSEAPGTHTLAELLA